ncbi:MAG: glycerol-3-phosphate 1-O-acyltransferase PlsY [Elusimicrobiota bacterium]|jgi:glycerol-3-phosphate acyltransferase PlsY|nr:glycerol-3-phosphate 1-O-acyltransferase PlsY [Elusimicrobiota bacterium]
MIIKIVYIVLSYLCGSIPFAYIFTKAFAGVDIRTVGSGNPGTTNVFRAAGKKVGSITFVADVLKGFVPVFFAVYIDPSFIFAALIALTVIGGHMFTIFLNFKGGKGVATALGAFLALLPLPSIIAAGVFAIVFLSSGIVALGSMCAAIALVIAAIIFAVGIEGIIFAAIVALIVIYKHKSNIKRIANGTENKFNVFGKKK